MGEKKDAQSTLNEISRLSSCQVRDREMKRLNS